jgi:hypothetical protein
LISRTIAASVVDLPEPVGPGDEDRGRAPCAELLEDGPQAELLHRRDDGRNRAHHRARTAVLVEHVHAVATDAGDLGREVDLEVLLEERLLAGVHDRLDQRLHGGRIQPLALQARQVAVQPDRRRLPRRKVQVRRTLLRHLPKQLVHRHGGPHGARPGPAHAPFPAKSRRYRERRSCNAASQSRRRAPRFDRPAARRRSCAHASLARRRPALIPLLLFCSGATGLAYEVLWARDWALVYGTTAVGVAVVLAAYFAGLAIGAPLGARLVRGRDGLRVYGALELAVAVAMLAYIALRPQLAPLASLVTTHLPHAIAPFARTALAFVVLLAPTIALGATLPAIAAVLARDDAAGAARLYAWNTLGGAAGAPLTGFVGVHWLGLRGTSLAAVAVDVAVAAAALTAARGHRAAPTPTRAPTRVIDAPAPTGALVQAFTVGFVALAVQVLWTRGLSGVLSNSAYSVTLVLTSTLVGIVLGAALASRTLAHRADADAAVAAATAAVLIAASRLVLEALPAWSLALIRTFGAPGATSGPRRRGDPGDGGRAAAVGRDGRRAAAPPAARRRGGRAPRSGRLLAANTCGGIAGACAAAFVILPRLGLGAGLLALAAVLVAPIALPARALVPIAVAIAAIALTALRGTALPLPWRQTSDDRVLFYRDGAEATVTVTADARDQKRLRVNGQYSLGGTSGCSSRAARRTCRCCSTRRRGASCTSASAPATRSARERAPRPHDRRRRARRRRPRRGRALRAREPERAPRAERPPARRRRAELAPRRRRRDGRHRLRPLPSVGRRRRRALLARPLRARARAPGARRALLPVAAAPSARVGDLRSIVATFASVFPHVSSGSPITGTRRRSPRSSARRRRSRPTPTRSAAGSPHRRSATSSRRSGSWIRATWLCSGSHRTTRSARRSPGHRSSPTTARRSSSPRPRPTSSRSASRPPRSRGSTVSSRPGDGPIAGAPAPPALRRTLLDAQRALLAGDRPSELRAYLTALPLAPALPTTRLALTAIERERRAAGDGATAAYIADALGER